jgi:hypothetical protein
MGSKWNIRFMFHARGIVIYVTPDLAAAAVDP